MMKPRLLALLLALALPVMVAGQEVVCTPFDNNGDNIVGIGDLIDLLARFGDSDLDQDGIWDSADDCVGPYDTCGVCNGPGPQVLAIDTIIITFDSIYVDSIDEWLTYELSRDTLLHLVCENPGCTDPLADNFDPYAEEGGYCSYLSCFGPTFDGYTYQAAEIGDQCWFSENLRTLIYSNGELIPSSLTEGEWVSTNTGATAVYGEGWAGCESNSPNINACIEAQSLETYGRLYNWYAVNDARGLCPQGWHVPTDGEWSELEDFLTSQGFVGTEGMALKSNTGWYNGGNGTDDFGFSALPGGIRNDNNGAFYNAGNAGFWWSSSVNYPNSGQIYYRYLLSGQSDLRYGDDFPVSGFAVRCLRDSE